MVLDFFSVIIILFPRSVRIGGTFLTTKGGWRWYKP